MPRKTYLDDEVLKEVAGRLRFGATNIEDRLALDTKPEPKPWAFPSHPLDEIASEFGMLGFEFKVLQEAAMREMGNHEILQHYYRKFLMAAKLVLNDELEKARIHERRQSEEKNQRDAAFQKRLREWEDRRNKLTDTWTKVRETIRTRWGRIGRSIATLVEQDAALSSMDARDVVFLKELQRRNIAVIEQGRVQSINWDRFADISIEDINDIILILDSDESGGFIAKPTVSELEASS